MVKLKYEKMIVKPRANTYFEDKPETTIKILMDFKNGEFNNINFL
ncbi:hypothetical protein [Wolbachia endosymbiont of Delia radicum]|nr:hypothetical protein [Wolbachia endosymbiont of Delia radicum]